jgi:hypothetical protein
MFAVRLRITTSPYRWPVGSLPFTYMLCIPTYCTKDVYTPQVSTRDLWTVGIFPFPVHHIAHVCPLFAFVAYKLRETWYGVKVLEQKSDIWALLHCVSRFHAKHFAFFFFNPWRYRLWRTLGRLSSRRWQSFPTAHVVSTSNPTAAFSAFQTGPLLLYSSNYSVYPVTRWVDPFPDPTPSEKS